MLVGPGQAKIAVVIPALNEEIGIGSVLDNLQQALGSCVYGVVVVDGYSQDDTRKIAHEKGAIVLSQSKRGYGNALKAGFAYACEEFGADIVVMADGDGTYDPFDVPAMIKPILSNSSDLVVGNRFKRLDPDSMPLVNNFGNRFLSLIAKILLKTNIADTQCGMRAIKATFLKQIRIESEGMPFATQMLVELMRAGARVTEIPIRYHARQGSTKMKRFRYGYQILKVILTEAVFI